MTAFGTYYVPPCPTTWTDRRLARRLLSLVLHGHATHRCAMGDHLHREPHTCRCGSEISLWRAAG
jgi:hypothetical protein